MSNVKKYIFTCHVLLSKQFYVSFLTLFDILFDPYVLIRFLFSVCEILIDDALVFITTKDECLKRIMWVLSTFFDIDLYMSFFRHFLDIL